MKTVSLSLFGFVCFQKLCLVSVSLFQSAIYMFSLGYIHNFFVFLFSNHLLHLFYFVCMGNGHPQVKLTVYNLFLPVWELRFHRTSPSYIFSCSEDGSVRRLNSSFEMKALSLGGSNIDVSELVPKCGSSMNSLDVSGTRMLCATDAESVYVIDDVI